jgi:hypothetical protein
MDRTTTGFIAFSAVACIAIAAMIVTGKSRHPRTVPPAGVSPAMAQEGVARTATRAAADPGGMDDPNAQMRIPTGYRTTNARDFMRMRLRELTVAEENYDQESNTYTTELSKLMLARRTGVVVVLRVTFAGPAGWSTEATHPAMPGKSCVTYAGPVTLLPRTPETALDHTQPLGERDLVCDKP